MSLLINFIGFQIGWFAAVVGGANELAWAGTLAVLFVIAIHLWRVSQPRKEFLLILVAGLLGFAWESALVQLGVTVYPSGVLVKQTAPHWIVAMWMLFATTLNISMRWLRSRWWLSAPAGAVFGPLAFYAGSELGGVYFPDLFEAMLIISAGWAVFMPLLLWVSRYLDGVSVNTPAREAQHV